MNILKSILVINLFVILCSCQDFKIDSDRSGVAENSQKLVADNSQKTVVTETSQKSLDDKLTSQVDNIQNSFLAQLNQEFTDKSVIQNLEDKPVEKANNKSEEDIYRPCPNNDLECIRFFFASRSYCRASYGKMPDEHFRPQTNLYYPLFSLSVTQVGTYSRGLNGTIKEFYVDKATDSIVLEIQFTNFLLNSTLDIYRFHRPGKVDAITRSDSRIYLPSFTITTVFRGTFNIDFGRSESNAFIETMGAFELNSSAGVHSDSIVSENFAKFSSSKLEVLKEGFLVLAPYYAGLFIQISICDFGAHLI